MDTISKLAAVVNDNLKLKVCLRTMYDPRNRLANEVSDQLEKHLVAKSIVPLFLVMSASLKRQVMVNQRMYYDKYSQGSKAYLAFSWWNASSWRNIA